jgi:hypothetical protein
MRAMRGSVFFVLLTALTLLAALAGCESRETPGDEASSASSRPTQPQFQPLKLATQPATLPLPPPGWKPTTDPLFSDPTTRASTRAAATEPASRPVDPLATPESTVRHFLELCSSKQLPDLTEVTSLLVESPPEEELVPRLNRVRRRLLNGATWEIVQTNTRNSAASVLFRATYRGRSDVSAILLLKIRERWKIVLGELNPKKYTPGEKEDLLRMAQWSQEQAATYQSSTTAPASAPASAPATTPAPLQ